MHPPHRTPPGRRLPVLGWLLAAVLLLAGLSAGAQLLEPVEVRQERIPFNLQSTNGVPLSSTNGTPSGSDGRAPTSQDQEGYELTTAVPTANQFRGLVLFGGVAAPRPVRLVASPSPNPSDVPGASVGERAVAIGQPRITSGGAVTHVLVRAQVGAPYLGRRLDYLFGSVIEPPKTTESGVLLSTDQVNAGYWLPEPHTTNVTHSTTDYYWSRHSRKVYAVRAGPVQIVWKRREPFPSGVPPPPDPANYDFVSGQYYRLMTNRYIVSSSVDPKYVPKQIYWTESTFQRLGKEVKVPAGQVSDVEIAYNEEVPRQVTESYDTPEDLGLPPPPEQGQAYLSPAERRTLWFDKLRGAIRAYNREGRVLVELLGDQKADGVSRESLGIEIVQLVKQPSPADVTIELGERLTAYPPQEGRDDADLLPEELVQLDGTTFVFRHGLTGVQRNQLYATRETRNANDLWVHWLEEGVAGLRWPKLTVRYSLVWPDDPAKYSHYVRPVAANEAEASQTAVSLPVENGGFIDWQDPLPRTTAGEQLGAKKTADQKFYTYLDAANPAHRTLVRYMAKEAVLFERVFSWLNTALTTQQEREASIPLTSLVPDSPFFGSVATRLSNWTTNSHLRFPDEGTSPRVVQQTVDVGQRLLPPAGELGSRTNDLHWAAHLRLAAGTDFDPTAYLDPFVVGFDEARRGAIIPVNARPERNRLETWWFRSNGFEKKPGFAPVYWPSVIGQYTIKWPMAPKEIVLASNHGSGALMSLEQKGTIYVQNDSALPGYNPNEEHGLMLGGQAYALRDDLNVVLTTNYTSEPYVLLKYIAADGRPAMTPFKVLREKPEAGWTFEYQVEAGTILQAPMPLPLLERPLVPRLVGEGDRSVNFQIGFLGVNRPDPNDSFPFLTTLTTTGSHFFKTYQRLSLQRVSGAQSRPEETRWFYVTSASYASRALTGIVSTENRPPVGLMPAAVALEPPAARDFRFTLLEGGLALNLAVNTEVVVVNPTTRQNWRVAVQKVDNSDNFVEVRFPSDLTDAMREAKLMIRPVDSGAAFDGPGNWQIGSSLRSALLVAEADDKLREFYSGFTLQDRKGNLWVYRGPHDPNDPGRFRMQFYYKTLPGFYFPDLPLGSQPEVGTITPYLRNEQNEGQRDYLGDAVAGDADRNRVGDGNPLWVTYQPVWPINAPVLLRGESLALPKRGLPAIRGQSSLEITYQQSQVVGVDGVSAPTVRLHDPTREKEFRLGDPDQSTVLEAIPDSILTQSYRGKTYFPNLPPHLAERFFLDPNRGNGNEFTTFGALVFRGEFKDEALGEDYLLLNALSANDIATLKALCLADDPRKKAWDAAIDGLSTTVERFTESPAKPGTYIVDRTWDPDGDGAAGRDVGPRDLAEILDDDEAVDSYGLSAVGPGTGFVTLIAGNGLAFTPKEEPVSVLVLRVADRLYPGELKVIESPNPLAEKVTLQQVTDLAAKAEQYEFAWRIASPVDGLPPLVYQNTRAVLLPKAQTWRHVALPLPTDRPGYAEATDPQRVAQEVRERVVTISDFAFNPASVVRDDRIFTLDLTSPAPPPLRVGAPVALANFEGNVLPGVVTALPAANRVSVTIEASANT